MQKKNCLKNKSLKKVFVLDKAAMLSFYSCLCPYLGDSLILYVSVTIVSGTKGEENPKFQGNRKRKRASDVEIFESATGLCKSSESLLTFVKRQSQCVQAFKTSFIRD